MDSLTSIIAGILVFSYLGFLANKLNVLCDEMINKNGLSGPKLALIGIPYAITKINYFDGCPQLVTALIFCMFLVIGFGSLYIQIEVVLNAMDQITV